MPADGRRCSRRGAACALLCPSSAPTPPLALQSWASPLLGGGVAGYVLYDTTHWALHSGRADWMFTRTLKSSHMEHHYVRVWGGQGRAVHV